MEPLVDVNIAVYNHSGFLRKTLDSVLSQKTNFSFRLVVGDDCSTDGSVEIIKEYEKKYPEKFLLILQKQNLGFHSYERNGTIMLKNSTAKYIALLDGDDYWEDPYKLQKQIDFLESNQDFTLCGGNTKIIYEDNADKVNYFRPDFTDCRLDVLSIQDQIKYDTPFHTSSSVFRNIMKEFPPFFYTSLSGDIIIFTLMAEKGLVKYFDDIFSVHRMHSGGITKINASQLEKKYANKSRMYKEINSYFNYKYNESYNDRIEQNLSKLILAFNRSGQYIKAYRTMSELFGYRKSMLKFIEFVFKNMRITLKGLVKKPQTASQYKGI